VDFSTENFYIEDGKLVVTKNSYTKNEQKYNSEADKRYILDRYFDNSNDTQIYIEGDFTKSLREALNYTENQPSYSLTGTNCAWLALDILQTSYASDSQTYKDINNLLWKTSTSHVPNNIGDAGKYVTRTYTTQRIIVPNNLAKKLNELWP
jgi:hypothetical protein